MARYTWARQWYALLLIGLSGGIFNLTPFLIRRSLGADAFDVALIIAVWQAPWILAPLVQPLMTRVHPQRAWRWMAVLAHLPLVFVALLPVESAGLKGRGVGLIWPLMVIVALYHVVMIGYIPHRGALLRTNYSAAVRGRLYGLIQVVTLLGITLANKGGGILMDRNAEWLRALYPAAAVLGAAGFWLHGRIRWQGQRRREAPNRASWKEMVGILARDRAFRTYEIGFMIYGVAFLSGWALLYLYAEGPLALSYKQLTNATGYAFPLALIVGAAVWGRLTDVFGVVRLTGVAFLALAAFYLVMLLVEGPLSYLAAFAMFGFAMAGVDVAWSLGPLHFAPDGEAHMYAALHFSLVGVRSAFAPFIGFAIAKYLWYHVAFACCATLLMAATLIIWRLARRSP